MPAPLTDLERRVLDYLIVYLRTNTYQPSIREIGREFAIKSTKTVSEVLQSLAEKGWVERDPSRSRGVRLLGVAVEGGMASLPVYPGRENDGADIRFDLDRRLLTTSSLYMLPMDGDHLSEQSIRNGDLLVVESVSADAIEAEDILVIRSGDESRVVRCTIDGGDLVLDATRPGDAPLRIPRAHAGEAVSGRVTTVVRRLRSSPAHAEPISAPIAT